MNAVAVLTSGGDAPGMNAAIRAAVRAAIEAELRAYGVSNGFTGLIENLIRQFDRRDVGGIMHRGGTVLRTAREPRFLEPQLQRQAVDNLRRHGIDGLVVIGGNGSMQGAQALDRLGVPVIGVPASIDNDLDGTDVSIGVDTALNTIVRAIDALKDTASAHERTFVVEVMGRNCGYLALMAGMAGGAEAVIVPESPPDYDRIVADLERGYARGKRHGILVCAEGAAKGQDVAAELSRRSALQLRVTVLGHVQRGGAPTVADRLLGTQLGAAAVDRLLGSHRDEMACWRNNAVVFTPLVETLAQQRPLSLSDQRLERVLAR